MLDLCEPKQFNDKKDLINYPRDETGDIRKLERANCNILFLPQIMIYIQTIFKKKITILPLF